MTLLPVLLRVLKWLSFAFVNLVAGLLGFSLLFSDLGPGDTWFGRLAIIFFLFLVTALLTGYFNPEAWWISGLISWGTSFLGAGGLLGGQANWIEPLALLALPVVFVLALGYAGAAARRKVASQRPPGG